ncbi:MAG: response regulator [Armatimonadetes bacterium]|nr:response regulator [Armatimonadota bacterium]
MRILVVDDEPQVLEPLVDLLAVFGYRCTPMSDPHEAADFCATHDFDLAIVDYSMPGMDGLELARRIRSVSPGTPVVILTAFGETFFRRQEREPEVAAVLQKPVGSLHLRAVIQRVVPSEPRGSKES